MTLPSQNAASRGSQSGPFVGVRKTRTITPGAIAVSTPVDVDFAFAGAQVGDIAAVSFDTALVDGVGFVGASVATAGHVTLRFAAFGTDRTQTAISANVGISKPL